MKRIALIVGARPQIIKSTPLIHLLVNDEEVEFQIIHTGQHYNDEMTTIFFRELALPDPLVNLNVVSKSHAEQTAAIMLRLEKLLNNIEVLFDNTRDGTEKNV